MKTIARLASLAAAALILAGCQSGKKQTAESAPTRSPQEILEAVRADLGRSAPTARLASVTEVDESVSWIALGNAPAGDFPVGTVVSIVDENQAVIGHAEVRQSGEGQIYAQFYKGAGRTARVGDVAVKF